MPALPLLLLTCRNASFKFARSHTSSMIRRVLAGRSGSYTTESDSMSSRPACRAFTRRRRWEVQSQLDVQPLVTLEIHVLLASLLVRAFSHRSRLGLSVISAFRHGVPH